MPLQKSPSANTKNVVAPMPGTIMRFMANEGDEIASGQTILVLEAMKMETEIKAEHPGKILEIHVSQGSTVATGEILVVMEVK